MGKVNQEIMGSLENEFASGFQRKKKDERISSLEVMPKTLYL